MTTIIVYVSISIQVRIGLKVEKTQIYSKYFIAEPVITFDLILK